MTDILNSYFRQFYPPDWNEAWETESLGGFYGRRYTGSHKDTHSTIFPRIVCVDGFNMSVQGHYGAYSSPRDDFANEYDRVEILGPKNIPELADCQGGECGEEMIYAYVPVQLVCDLIEAHGGLAIVEAQSPSGEA